MEKSAWSIELELDPTIVPGGDAAFTEMLGDELPRLARIARLLVGSTDAADDLVAEAITRTLPKWREGTVADPPAYLRRVLVNLAHRRWRRRRLAFQRDHASLDWLQPATDSEARATERDRTLHAIAELPARRRAVVVLRFYDDLPEAEIAQVLGIGLGTVKSTLSRAIEQLREKLGTLEGS
ncbi:MAG: SigE family RNA polymerase sigma factor [Actinobacteria bacterium]|nr:SigE family RNA polymerase sigma factor [Actinomycetota bacterium]